jgi:hypothetical protein
MHEQPSLHPNLTLSLGFSHDAASTTLLKITLFQCFQMHQKERCSSVVASAGTNLAAHHHSGHHRLGAAAPAFARPEGSNSILFRPPRSWEGDRWIHAPDGIEDTCLGAANPSWPICQPSSINFWRPATGTSYTSLGLWISRWTQCNWCVT